MSWIWDETDAGKIGLSGDIAKLFRHETPKSPGVFAFGTPPAPATILAREVIQNSWDAARELRGDDPSAPQFQIEFRYRELLGEDKQSLAHALDLRSLTARIGQVDRRSVGLSPHDCLDSIDQDETPLRVLYITESGATGMYGPWQQNKSHMYLALVSLGYTEKLAGAGGTYGYGKAGLINGSRIRSVVAYTCFRERADAPGTTRRLLGMTYWGQHDIDDVNFTGIGSFSAGREGRIEPFENEEADRVANALGFELRQPSNSEQLGTSFLLVDPTVVPEDLVRAIERFWWPALHENDFVATVVDVDGSVQHPRPMRDEALRTFIDAWDVASGRREARRGEEWHSELSGPERYPTVGTLGLVADLRGWSYADQVAGPEEDGVTHKSLVALTRGPRMVVEYLEAGQSPPYIRGAFIADESVGDLLRRTEPKAHDSWRTKAEEGEVDPDAAAVADHVIKRIKQTVNNHRIRLKPPVPPPEEINLPFFNEVIRRVMSGMGTGVRQPVPDTRPISIRLEHRPLEAPGGRVKVEGSATFSLSENFEGETALAKLTITYRFLEDERVGEHAALTIRGPDGFAEEEPGVLHGRLARDREARFEFVSEPYDTNWSGRLIVNGDTWGDQTEEAALE